MVREVFEFQTENEAIDTMAYEDSVEFSIEESEQIYFDSEKKCSDYEVILKRLSDGKFFKGKYTNWGCGQYEAEMELTEVFPKTITKTIYE